MPCFAVFASFRGFRVPSLRVPKRLHDPSAWITSTQLEPIGAGDNRASHDDEYDEKYNSAAASRATASPAKTEPLFHPVENGVQ